MVIESHKSYQESAISSEQRSNYTLTHKHYSMYETKLVKGKKIYQCIAILFDRVKLSITNNFFLSQRVRK